MKQGVLPFVFVFFTATIVFPQNQSFSKEKATNTLITVEVSNPNDIDNLTELGLCIEAEAICNSSADGLISRENLARVRSAGYTVSVLDEDIAHSFRKIAAHAMSTSRKPWYDFDGIRDKLKEWQGQYPSLVSVDTLGYSQKDEPIWEFRISGSPDTAARQRIFLSGSTHGNEKIGTEICMWLADYLLTGYESNTDVKEMVDRSEFQFIPIVNPDGFIKHSRWLENGADPNRSFAFQVGAGGQGAQGAPYEYPEMAAYGRSMHDAPRYLSIDYHCGMVALLLPFFCEITEDFDKNAYSTINGIYKPKHRQVFDYFNRQGQGLSHDCPYARCGALAIMPEVSQHNPPEIEPITEHNLECILNTINEMQKGICGRVRDAQTGAPVYARVTIAGNYAPTYTDPRSGAYFKYIPSPSGSFEVTVFANGYTPETKTVQAVSNDFAQLDFELTFDPELKYAALSIVAMSVANSMKHSELYACLESPDDNSTTIKSFSSGKGLIDLDFGPRMLITNKEGDDLTVHSSSSTSYTVSAANDVISLGTSNYILGTSSGTGTFDLGEIGLDSARFVQISCASGSVAIDAVEAEPRDDITQANNLHAFTVRKYAPGIVTIPHGSNSILVQAYIPKGQFSIELFDTRGRKITTLAEGYAHHSERRLFRWHENDAKSQGISLVLIKNSQGKEALKGAFLR